jgi:prepilin-type N-terminal cleavage/methylation domain-containing protein
MGSCSIDGRGGSVVARVVVMRKAFTLPEVLMASAILAFAVAAISFAVSTGQAQTHNALHELRALSLAEAMLEEIVAFPFSDPDGGAAPGPDAGESDRWTFDNCDDYHGYAEPLGEVLDADGEAYHSSFARFSRSVTCTYDAQAIAPLGGAISGLTVTVTVTDDKGRAWQARRFIPEPLQ